MRTDLMVIRSGESYPLMETDSNKPSPLGIKRQKPSGALPQIRLTAGRRSRQSRASGYEAGVLALLFKRSPPLRALCVN